MAKPPGKCIFCEGRGLSKEHIFPEWIQGVLPKRFRETTHKITRGADHQDLGIHSSYRPVRQGDPLARKVYVVCKSCNSGWMSRLQTRAKPIATLLIGGGGKLLTVADQKTLSAWMAMTTMVIEFADPPTVAATQTERALLKSSEVPPPNWQIWLGTFVGEQDRSFWHTSFGLILDNPPPNVPQSLKGQITTVRLGRMFACILSTPSGVHAKLSPIFEAQIGIWPIWPPNRNSATRTAGVLNDEDADRVHNLFRDTFQGFAGN